METNEVLLYTLEAESENYNLITSVKKVKGKVIGNVFLSEEGLDHPSKKIALEGKFNSFFEVIDKEKIDSILSLLESSVFKLDLRTGEIVNFVETKDDIKLEENKLSIAKSLCSFQTRFQEEAIINIANITNLMYEENSGLNIIVNTENITNTTKIFSTLSQVYDMPFVVIDLNNLIDQKYLTGEMLEKFIKEKYALATNNASLEYVGFVVLKNTINLLKKFPDIASKLSKIVSGEYSSRETVYNNLSFILMEDFSKAIIRTGFTDYNGSNISKQDLINSNINTEFIKSFHYIINMKKLTKENIEFIIKDPNISPFYKYQELTNSRLIISETVYENLINIAEKNKLNISFIEPFIDELMLEIIDVFYNINNCLIKIESIENIDGTYKFRYNINNDIRRVRKDENS